MVDTRGVIEYETSINRRQTLAFKGFLVTGCESLYFAFPAFRSAHEVCYSAFQVTIFGLVTYAETALQALEREERVRESAIRRDARIDLSRRGMVPTETAIAEWRAARLQEAAEAAAAKNSDSTPQ